MVVPCFNEGKTIHQNLNRIYAYLNSKFSDFEIIAVNDGSSDNTKEELERARADFSLKVINNKINEGKGRAVRDGIISAQGEIVMFLDADLGIPVEELEKFISEIKNGDDLVIASRFVPGGKVKKPVLWHRKYMEKSFRILRMIIVNDWNVKDTQCGFKVFRREAAINIFRRLTVKRFAFDAEVIFIANKFEYKIKELPITLQNPILSHIRLIRDPLNMIWDLLRIRMNDWRGKYK